MDPEWETDLYPESISRPRVLYTQRIDDAAGRDVHNYPHSRTRTQTQYTSAPATRGSMEQGNVAAGGLPPPAPMKKSARSKGEDALLREQVRLHGAEKWLAISAGIPGRSAKSCRLRWCQHLLPGLDTATAFTADEDARILHYQRLFPNKWSTIAGYLPGRTDNAIKNRWNYVLGKRQREEAPAATDHGRDDGRTLKLFRMSPGDIRLSRRDLPVLITYCPPADEDEHRNAACLELFPLRPGDIVSDSPPVDVDCGAGDPLTKLRVWPSKIRA